MSETVAVLKLTVSECKNERFNQAKLGGGATELLQYIALEHAVAW